MVKFNRNYRLSIQTDDDLVIIEPPFTIMFNAVRGVQASLNSLSVQIYNLGEKTRNKLFKDRFNFLNYQKVILEIGYSQLTTIFIGNLFEASSTRQGADIITSLEARDGGFDVTGTQTSKTLRSGASIRDVIAELIGDFANLKQGTIGDFNEKLLRPVTLDGNTFNLIKQYSDDNAFIDLEEVNVLKGREVIQGTVPLINSATGLLETPKRENAYLTIKTLLEPQIIMGQIIELESSILPIYNGQYKVIGANHSATISEAINGSAVSTFSLLLGSQLFGSYSIL